MARLRLVVSVIVLATTLALVGCPLTDDRRVPDGGAAASDAPRRD